MVKKLQFVAAISGALALAACRVGPNFVPPDPAMPKRWFTRGAAAAPANFAGSSRAVHQAVDPAWWKVFHDATLTSLVKRVAYANLDVRTATVRLAQSRFQRNVVAAALLPGVQGNARYQHATLHDVRIKSRLIDDLLGSPSITLANAQPADILTSGFDASWELDFWGHVRRQVESANAQVLSSEEQRRDALVSSLAETARD